MPPAQPESTMAAAAVASTNFFTSVPFDDGNKKSADYPERTRRISPLGSFRM